MADNKPLIKHLDIEVNLNTDSAVAELKTLQDKFSEIFVSDDKEKISNAFGKGLEKSLRDKRAYEILTGQRSRLKESMRFASGEERKLLKESLNAIEREIKKTNIYQREQFSKIKDEVSTHLDTLKDNIGDFFENILNNVKTYINDMRSYNVSGSIFGTGEARRTMFQWGTSEAQTYAFSRTRSMLGLTSDEDLWYMNENQREKFAELIGRYTSKYESLANKDFFKAYEEYQLEFSLLKEELSYDLIGVIMDNKDLIVEFMTTGTEAMKSVINFLGSFTRSQVSSRSVSDIMSAYSSNISNNSNAYSFSNVFNVADTSLASAQTYASNMINTIKQLRSG